MRQPMENLLEELYMILFIGFQKLIILNLNMLYFTLELMSVC